MSLCHRVKDDNLTVFLALTLIHKTPQAEGICVRSPKSGSEKDNVYDCDYSDAFPEDLIFLLGSF